MRIPINKDPFEDSADGHGLFDRGIWPCHWIQCPDTGPQPYVAAYRRIFTIEKASTIRIHVSADEYYELFIDGRRIGRGPERGDANNWFFETYDLSLDAGRHVIVAKVRNLGPAGLRSQISIIPGFILAPQEPHHIELIGTGVADWQAKKIPGWRFERPFEHDYFSVGFNNIIDGTPYPWGFEHGDGEDWQPVIKLHAGANAFLRNRYPAIHLMKPAMLPPMIEKDAAPGLVRFISETGTNEPKPLAIDPGNHIAAEAERWNAFLRGNETVTIPANTSRRIIIDLENYVCAYPAIHVSGGRGSSLRLHWAESLFNEPEAKTKGNRDEIAGKYFSGIGDTFYPDGAGARIFEPLLWRAGRYLEIAIQTADSPLTLETLALRETHYPLEPEIAFESDDPRLAAMIPRCVRTLQMSAHDSFIDGPYYEQMMWAGDSVQTSLVTSVLTRDDRLQRKSLLMFDSSRLPSGLTRARWPARDTLIIAPYALYCVEMLCIFSLWRDGAEFVRSLMPGVRGVIDAFLGFLNRDGLVEIRQGWNFVDWVPDWPTGVPPGANDGPNSVINWQFVYTLRMLAILENHMREPELAERANRLATQMTERINTVFWNQNRRLYADDPAHKHFSEHAQCFAILALQNGGAPPESKSRIALLEDTGLARATISFSHYLFEAYRELGRVDAMLARLDYWHSLDELGLKTLPEIPEPSRSDCHAWSAHPLYHFFTCILGIKPMAPGFGRVAICPRLGPLKHARGTMVHPRGSIEAEFRKTENGIEGYVILPPGLDGIFMQSPGTVQMLKPGRQEISASNPLQQ